MGQRRVALAIDDHSLPDDDVADDDEDVEIDFEFDELSRAVG